MSSLCHSLSEKSIKKSPVLLRSSSKNFKFVVIIGNAQYKIKLLIQGTYLSRKLLSDKIRNEISLIWWLIRKVKKMVRRP